MVSCSCPIFWYVMLQTIYSRVLSCVVVVVVKTFTDLIVLLEKLRDPGIRK
jgi:hypothetical protein